MEQVGCNAAVVVVLEKWLLVGVAIMLGEVAVAKVALAVNEVLFVLVIVEQEENSGYFVVVVKEKADADAVAEQCDGVGSSHEKDAEE